VTVDPRLLEKNLATIGPNCGRMVEWFYAQLFHENPELRDMFPAAMDTQNDRLFTALMRIIGSFEDSAAFETYLQQLGRDHRKFAVQPEHYHAVGRCLISAIRRYCRQDWTAEDEQNWVEAYRSAAGQMVAAAEEAAGYEPPWWSGEIIGHERRTVDTAVIRVRTDQVLPYQAGQYVTVETQRWPRIWRAYSMAGAPRLDRQLEFHVKSVGAGMVSSTLVHFSDVGDRIRVGAATGGMILDHGSERDVLLCAGGTGWAPIRAIVEDLARTNRSRRARLFIGARRREEVYDRPAVLRFLERYPWLEVTTCVSDEPPSRYGRPGTVPEVLFASGDWSEYDAYVCGPTPMVRETVAGLQQRGLPPARIRYDDFGDFRM